MDFFIIIFLHGISLYWTFLYKVMDFLYNLN